MFWAHASKQHASGRRENLLAMTTTQKLKGW
jgi:hypothetical protein